MFLRSGMRVYAPARKGKGDKNAGMATVLEAHGENVKVEWDNGNIEWMPVERVERVERMDSLFHKNAAVEVPDPDDNHVLRNVEFDGYRLMTWETGRRASTGQELLGYAMWAPGAKEPLFVGDDYGVAPAYSIDGDESLRGLLGFLTLRPGDTDDEYFEHYTPEQLAFAEGDAEQLSIWGMDPEDFGEGEASFRDIEHDVYRNPKLVNNPHADWQWKMWTGPVGVKQVAEALRSMPGTSHVYEGTEHVYFDYDGDVADLATSIASPAIVRAHARGRFPRGVLAVHPTKNPRKRGSRKPKSKVVYSKRGSRRQR